MKRKSSHVEGRASPMAKNGTLMPRRSARLAGKAPAAESETAFTGVSITKKKKSQWNAPDSSSAAGGSNSVSTPDTKIGRSRRFLGLDLNRTPVPSTPVNPSTKKYTEEQKGKRKLFVEDSDGESMLELRIGRMTDREGLEDILVADNGDKSGSNEGSANNSDDLDSTMHLRIGEMSEECIAACLQTQHETERKRIAESQRFTAAQLAPGFAKPEQEEESESNDDSINEEPEDWPGPFTTAMKIINDREKLLRSRRKSTSFEFSELKIDNLPSPKRETKFFIRKVPSLRDLCLETLSEYASEIKSLDGVPDYLKNQLSHQLCCARKMDEKMMGIFVGESPTEINIPDCSWATEEQLGKILRRIATDRLVILELNICGRCLYDGMLSSSRNLQPRFPALIRISLKGAYRLSDEGLKELTISAPQLAFVDLSQCSRITYDGVNALLDKLQHSLVKLVLDDCNIDGASILAGLQKLENLEALSVAGVEGITDRFVRSLVSVHGARLTDLGFCGCKSLSAASLKEIGKHCSRLRFVDFRDLVKLNDHALAHLAGGCTSLRRLLFRRNSFSDRAMAAFLQAAGGQLTDLSVNNIREVSNFTAQAIATQCAFNLETLDVSFSRKMTNEGVALIIGNCSRLSTLKLFGCSQISATFLDDYSHSKLNVLGIEGPILSHLRFRQSSY